MKAKLKLLAVITVMMLPMGGAWALADPWPGKDKPKTEQAPEIDAASGTSAIALLTGVLLLVGERSRSRRS